MAGRLQNKVALVFGAGSIGPGWGNGKATAVLYAREGARLAIVDSNPSAVEETAGLIRSEGGDCLTLVADVTNARQVETAVDATVHHFQRIDILHNNVGFASLGGPVELSEEVWDKAIDLNLKSMFLTCKYVLPVMVRQGAGAIVNISSISSLSWLGSSYVSYAAAKAGVNQLSRAIAMEYARKGIRCNVVLPGLMHTPTAHAVFNSQFANSAELIRKRNELCPTGQMGDAWDVAHASLFLASDEAKYVNGVLLPVDGGLTCQAVSPAV